MKKMEKNKDEKEEKAKEKQKRRKQIRRGKAKENLISDLQNDLQSHKKSFMQKLHGKTQNSHPQILNTAIDGI